MARKKKPRPEGSVKYVHRQKKAKFLLNILNEDHNFDVVAEILKTYKEADALLDPVEKIRLKRSIQRDLMKYCFPVLKSTEVKTDAANTTIHLHIPAPTKHVAPAPLPMIDEADVVDGEVEE